ncbi:MAG: hypothetical protein KY476_16150 [Planctomycetes bacterium]|nr:hypothetical protein [Planctomycetota bacterium]
MRPLVWLVVFVVLVAAFDVAYVIAGRAYSGAAVVLSSLVLAFAFICWAVADARRMRGLPCYDFGFFLTVLYPVSVLIYPFWSRGLRGLMLMPVLIILMLAPSLCVLLVWRLLYA